MLILGEKDLQPKWDESRRVENDTIKIQIKNR